MNVQQANENLLLLCRDCRDTSKAERDSARLALEQAIEEESVDKLEVGKAYRGPDSLVRWVTHESSRGHFHLLWLDEESGIWYVAGKVRSENAHLILGESYAPPQPGETYKLMGPHGLVQRIGA